MDQNQSSRHIDTISVIAKQGTKTQFKHAHNVAYKKNGKPKRDRQKNKRYQIKKAGLTKIFFSNKNLFAQIGFLSAPTSLNASDLV